MLTTSCFASTDAGFKAKSEKVNSIQEILDSLPKYENQGKVKVTYKGAFEIGKEDLPKLSDYLKTVKAEILITLDFSECHMQTAGYNLEYSSFSCVDSLYEVYLPENLTDLGYACFSSCDNLRAVYFPKNTTVHYIGWKAFNDDKALEEVHLYNYDGEIQESFRCQEGGHIKILEVPDHPIYLRDYGIGYYQYAFGNTKVDKVVTPNRTMTFDEWVEQSYSMRPKTGLVETVTASSELKSSAGENKYAASNAANGQWTSWVEGSSGDGSGESISITLKEATTIDFLYIKNGFGNLAYYWTNNRPKEITIIFDDDEKSARKHTLSDTPIAQYVNISKFDRQYSKLTIRIDSVYQGTDPANDCAIDEIAVNAGISRRQEYGAYYTSEDLAYVYDPEIQRMLKGLYCMDVGNANVRISKEGFVEVKATDWETGERYWTRPSGAFSGKLYNDFFPGTGGGHSYDCFQIYLNPNGQHILITWHDESYGSFELYPVNLAIFAWKKGEWQKETIENHSPALNEIFNLLAFSKEKDLPYDFYIGEYDDDVQVTLYPKGVLTNLPVRFSFEYDEKNAVFKPYEKNVQTELAFGTPESLSSIEDWKEKCKKEETASYDPIQIISYPAAYNPDPQMIDFLCENGFTLENEYKKSDNKSEPYKVTAIEAWNRAGNNDKVREALLKHGASYSQKMLCDSIDQDDRVSFVKLEALVTSYDEVLDRLTEKIGWRDTSSETLKYYFNRLKNRGVKFGEKQISAAIEAANIELTKYFLAEGCTIPQYLDSYDADCPLTYHALKYCENSKSVDEEYDPKWKAKWEADAKKHLDFMNFLFAQGLSADETDKRGRNILYYIADRDYSITKHHVKIAELFISRGADVNKIGSDGSHVLYKFFKESGYTTENYKENQKAFLNLLLKNGAYPEYALVAFFEDHDAEDIFDDSDYLDFLKEYLSKSSGRNVISDHDRREPAEVSLPIFLLRDYSPDEGYDKIYKMLFDAGFSAYGTIDYNGTMDPVYYFLTEKMDGELDNEEMVNTLNLLIEKRLEAGQTDLGQVMYDFVWRAANYYLYSDLEGVVEYLFEKGADWRYERKCSLNNDELTNCAQLLLLIDKDDIKDRPDEYINIAKLFIEHGAGDVLTEAAFKKAKVPAKVYKKLLH